MRAPLALLVIAAALAAGSGCGGDDGATTGTAAATSNREAAPANREAVRRHPVEPASCPSGVPGCRSATGRIAYVERVDPDGDGDAHFVIVDPQGISLPGLTSIDVRRGLRPHPLPGPGDLISAAGPVQTGSYGQRQIHALELHVAGGGG